LAVAVLALLGRTLISNYLDPEIGQDVATLKTKFAWSERMTGEHGNKVVFCGGSSCAHSIMSMRLLEQHNMPAVNMGMYAQLGTLMLTRCTLAQLHRGDTLIIAVEPPLLVQHDKTYSTACRLSFAAGHPEWPYMPWNEPYFPYFTTFLKSNIGLTRLSGIANYHFQKDILRRPVEKQLEATVDASGWATAPERKQIVELPPYESGISPEHAALLLWIRQWGDRNGIRVAYSLPWAYRSPANVKSLQKTNLSILLEINKILPVLKDQRMGAHPRVEDFSDTYYHLIPEAAAKRTDELARQIQAWDIWNPGELEAWGNANL